MFTLAPLPYEMNALEPIIAASVGKRASSKLASSTDIEKTWTNYSDAQRRLVIVE